VGLLVLLLQQPSFPQVEKLKDGLALITVGANVHVSKARDDQPHWEVIMASDPSNPRNLLACSIVGDEGWPQQPPSVVTYASFDRGKTWQETLNIAIAGGMAIDPTCAYGSDGTAYATALTYGFNFLPFYKSTDAGRTWLKPVNLPVRWGMDRPYIAVDNTASKYRGQIYLNALGLVPSIDGDHKSISSFDLWRSSDAGEIFLGPTRLAVTEADHAIGSIGNGVVLSDGTFTAITSELNFPVLPFEKDPYQIIGRILIVSSRDGGQTFLPPVTVSNWYHDRGHRATSSVVPVLAVDDSPGLFKDNLYAVWPDLRSGRMAVMISHSSDKGKTWSTPITVSDESMPSKMSEGYGDCNPTVSVNSSGVVGVMWYDRRESRDGPGYWARFSASLDGGETFLPSVKVSEAPSSFQIPKLILSGSKVDPRGHFVIGANFRQLSAGDTSGLTASPDGVFHALWVDNRTGVPQVWTAPVMVAAHAVQNGSDELSTLINVTERVRLLMGRPIYDREKHSVTIDARLENNSKDSFRGPIKVQLVSLSSQFAQVLVGNSDNNVERVGAIWDFTQQLKNGLLNSSARSESRRLEFSLTENPGATRSYEALVNMIQLQVKVLAGAVRAN
jgi:hypothetical protein